MTMNINMVDTPPVVVDPHSGVAEGTKRSGTIEPTPAFAKSHGKVAGLLARLWAVLRLRCPRCFQGKVFKGSFAMYDPCPVCGVIFQREEGYFLGAMYVSYILASAFMVSLYFAGQWLWPDLNSFLLVFAIAIVYLPVVPGVFRYSRVIWMHLERSVCPGDISATVYEKVKRQEIERQSACCESH
jgi:uncharacterized protein (DUF983 family)